MTTHQPQSNPPPKFKRVKTPTVLQMEAVECGAAALAIVLAFHGRIVPLEEVRLACGVSRDGSKASNMLKAAAKYGLIGKGFRREPADLKIMPSPMIIHWNFNHFLVVEGFGKNKVYLNDPGEGPRTVTYEEFDGSFSGVVLTFEPGPDFQRGGNKPSLAEALDKRLSGSRIGLVYVLLVSLLLVFPGLITPFFTQSFIDNYLVWGRNEWVQPLLIGMALAAIAQAVLTWFQQYYLARLETKLALATSSRFLWHVLRLPIEFYMQRFGGEIGARVELNDRVAQLLAGELATTTINILVIVFYALVMFQYDLVLTLVGIFIAILNFAALSYVNRKRIDGNRRLLQARGKLVGTSMNGLQIVESIKSGGTEMDFFSRWAGLQARLLNAEQQLGLYTQLLSVVPPTLSAFSNIAILSIGGLRVMDGSLTIGMLIAFQSLMFNFIQPFGKMVNLGGQLQEAEGNMNRLDDVFHYRLDPQACQDTASNSSVDLGRKLAGYVELKNLHYGYSRLSPPLIADFNLKLKPGDRVALVGGSGSGKSTVAKLIAGLYQTWDGEILFDHCPVDQLPRALIANSVALVDQDIFVYEGTVRENLTLWDATVPDAHMVQAAKDACIHEEITARAGGYASRVDEGGSNFSGGQRQRLEIARALVGNPTILVLDEATSALDPITERLIDENLRRRGCTCLIIAHRLSTIRDCDEILVLDHGQIVQRGTHDTMIKEEGPYRRLIQSDTLKAEVRESKSILERLV